MTRIEALRAAHGHLLAGQFGAALALVRPDDAAGALLHALALAGSGDVEGAAPLLAAIAEANPAAAHPLLDLVSLLGPKAAPHLRAGLRLRTDDPRLWSALGTALAATGPMGEAVDAFARAAALRPGDAAGFSNLGKALAAEGRFTASEAAFAAALRLDPASPQIAYNRAVMLLKAGRWGEGWAALAVRHRLPGRPPPRGGARLRDLDVAGRTVLLVHDEGFGDTLQFIRYAALLAARGARVIAAMPDALRRLIATVPGVAEVVPLHARPAYDLWSPLLDVPALFEGGPPAFAPYLRADPGPVLPPGRRIGLVWAGDPKGMLDRDRSMPVAVLEPLRARPDVTWVSLQHGLTPPGWMHDPMRGVRDFADTATVVAGLDAVWSVDTAVAHLAAAMGRPVVLMDRYDSCWRWLTGRTDSPWYPTLRIVRQRRPGDWDGVVARLSGPDP